MVSTVVEKDISDEKVHVLPTGSESDVAVIPHTPAECANSTVSAAVKNPVNEYFFIG